MVANYTKRLIEVDLPIKRISEHARREKSIRHGHISTLHIWWARRPLAACRAVLCAALWPDPADPNCPLAFRVIAHHKMLDFADKLLSDHKLHRTTSQTTFGRMNALAKHDLILDLDNPKHLVVLRESLLDFIADFANWDNSTELAYLETARALTQAAHEGLGGVPGTHPLVVDPFAGGGAIPLEALRVGADAFASDLNPVAVLLNKVVLEYIPRYGMRLVDEVQKWGAWITEQAKQELSEYYPKDDDGATPIAYLWARTIVCEGPNCGCEVPLMRSFWLAKKANKSVALRLIPKPEEKSIDFEIVNNAKGKEFNGSTVVRGSAICPCCGYTTPVERVRAQLKIRRGGTADARLFAIVTTRDDIQGRFYRLPSERDVEIVRNVTEDLEQRKITHNDKFSLVPDEKLDVRGIRHTWAMIYGLEVIGDYFTPRQSTTLITLGQLIDKAVIKFGKDIESDFATAVQTCIALTVDKTAQYNSSLCRWKASGEGLVDTFGRQALPMVWDFAEANPIGDASGDFGSQIQWQLESLRLFADVLSTTYPGQVSQESATNSPLPNDSVDGFMTDPPYYDAVPYSYLSDFFYVWLKRYLSKVHTDLFSTELAPKDEEIIVDRAHILSNSHKNIDFYEKELTKAFSEGRRILQPNGIGTIVFASKTTASWEAILKAVVDAGWTITGSWPIDTEMETRVAAHGQARLASSIHLVCRPREDEYGNPHSEIGDWRDVLSELPKRIREWLPRLEREGVVGADAIFACLGPAMEIYSRYAHVEKANGDKVTLRDYLEQVWAAVSREALTTIFRGADTSGFEEDARLTAMWLWTLNSGENVSGTDADDELEDDDETGQSASSTLNGFVLEYDAARKIAQGIGAYLEKLGNLAEIKGNKARLLPVNERAIYLFGKDAGKAPTLPKKANKQLSLFQLLDEAEAQEWHFDESDYNTGKTTLDRLHQSMILHGTGRTDALRRFLVEEGHGRDSRFWRLADSLLRLYPKSTDEYRWLDGLLARKKGLGL